MTAMRVLVLILVALGGCDRGTDAPDPKDLAMDLSGTLDMGRCLGPLAEYCNGGNCPSYAEQVQRERMRPMQIFCESRIGVCASGFFVQSSRSGFDSTIRYYDKSGTVIAVRVESDIAEYCDHTSFNKFYADATSFPDTDACVRTETICPCASTDGGCP